MEASEDRRDVRRDTVRDKALLALPVTLHLHPDRPRRGVAPVGVRASENDGAVEAAEVDRAVGHRCRRLASLDGGGVVADHVADTGVGQRAAEVQGVLDHLVAEAEQVGKGALKGWPL